MIVIDVNPVVTETTFGVALSVAGGEFHVAQPPLGTVRTVTVVENVRVCDPPVREVVVEKLAPGTVISVVPLVYVGVGVEIVVN